MIMATALPLLRKDAWWIRVLDFPRIQITILSAATLAAYLTLRGNTGVASNLFTAVLSLCLLYQSYMMRPYTFLSRKQVQQSRNPRKESSLSLLFANVLID